MDWIQLASFSSFPCSMRWAPKVLTSYLSPHSALQYHCPHLLPVSPTLLPRVHPDSSADQPCHRRPVLCDVCGGGAAAGDGGPRAGSHGQGPAGRAALAHGAQGAAAQDHHHDRGHPHDQVATGTLDLYEEGGGSPGEHKNASSALEKSCNLRRALQIAIDRTWSVSAHLGIHLQS